MQNSDSQYIRELFIATLAIIYRSSLEVVKASAELMKDTTFQPVLILLAIRLREVNSIDGQKIVVSELKEKLMNNYSGINIDFVGYKYYSFYYEVIWKLAISMEYPSFYQAWH